MALVTPQHSVNVGKLYAVLQPPARGAGYELPAVSHKGFTALVSPAARVAVEHRPIVTDLGLIAGSETHAAHIKDLMFLSHNIPPGQPLRRPASVRLMLASQYPVIIQQAGASSKESKR